MSTGARPQFSPPGQECLLSPRWLAALAILYLAFAAERLTNTTADPDLWGYLAFARLWRETGRFPYQDVFAYLPTWEMWVYHEWLTGVILFPLFSWAGPSGLQVLKYGLGMATAGFIYLTARCRAGEAAAIFLALFLVQAFFSQGYSPLRAQVFTFAFFALTLYLLESARQTKRWRRLAWLVPLQMVWANLHGGFLAGVGLTLIYLWGALLTRQVFAPYAWALIFSLLASLINPYGLDYWRYLFQAVTLPRPEITEWVSLLGAWQRGKFLWEFLHFLLVGGITFLLLLLRRLADVTVWSVLVLLFLLGLKHLRHQVFFYLAVGAFLPTVLTPILRELSSSRVGLLLSRPRMRPWLVLAFAVITGWQGYVVGHGNPLTLKLPPLPDPQLKSAIYYPVQAVGWIKGQGVAGSLLTEFNWGEYLIWELYPQCRVSLDGRFETVYPPQICQEYFACLEGREGWREFLTKYPPQLILLAPSSPLSRLLQKEQAFQEVYRDAGCILFLRRQDLAGPAGDRFREG